MKKYSPFLFFAVSSLFLIVIWGLNKGFDFTDEGFYLLKYQEEYRNTYDVFTFYSVVQLLFGWIDLNIFNIRLIRLFLVFASSLVFSFGLFTYIRNILIKKVSFLFVFLFSTLAGLLSYGYGPHSVYYNSLSGYFMVICIGFILLFFSLLSKRHKTLKTIVPIIIGFTSALILFAKIPAGIVNIFFIFLLFIFFSRSIFCFLIKITTSISSIMVKYLIMLINCVLEPPLGL